MPNLTLGNLKARGAIIDVVVGLSAPRAGALERAGRPPVLPVVRKALIDTGAISTCLDYTVVEELGLLPKGATSMMTPTTGPQGVLVPIFDVQLQLYGPPIVTVSPAIRVCAMDLSGMGIGLLLGRDALVRCLLFYNGSSDQFTFSF